MEERKRINTAKTLHNSYLDADKYDYNFNVNTPMAVDPIMDAEYDYALTTDPELLLDRKNTLELVHKIFTESEYNDGRYISKGKDGQESILKIPKDDTKMIFLYMSEKLQNEKILSPIETLIAINEYFDFNYDFIYKKVLTPTMKLDILEDLYNNEGLKTKLSRNASIRLF